MTQSRDSAESLDVGDLEEVPERESGLRPVPIPRGLWSSAKAPSAPPPIPKAPPVPKSFGLELNLPPPQRFDMDDLMADLSSRPPPRVSPAAGLWEIPSIGPAPKRASSVPAPAPAPARPVALLIGVGVVAYALGILTMLAIRPPLPQVEREPAAAAAPVEEPIAHEPVAAEPPAVEAPVVVAAPVVEVPAPVAAPIARSAPRVRPPAVEPVALQAPVEETPVVEEQAAPAPDPSIPETPSREDVQAAMSSVRPAIQACAQPADRGQQPIVRFTFVGSGRASHAVASGVGGPTASCIARAAREASVPAFSRDRFVVEFPFQL